MSTSRRAFLKTTLAGAGAAWGGAQSLAKAPAKSTEAAPLPASSGELPSGAESSANAPEYTRGVGVYPGNPREDFSPVLVIDGSTYRNLALRRPAYHSSSYDYNLTAQLVTDGIKHTRLPDWVTTSVSFRGPLPKLEREFVLDHNATSTVELRGPRPWVQIQLGGGQGVPVIDRVDVLVVVPPNLKPENLTITVSVSEDGREWKKSGSVTAPKPASLAGYPMGFAMPGRLFTPSIPLMPAMQSRFYRLEFEAAHAPAFAFGMEWQVGEVAFFYQEQRV
ncbi:MAG: hypothetical protein ABSA70_17440, partial [Terriglobia bacterium]